MFQRRMVLSCLLLVTAIAGAACGSDDETGANDPGGEPQGKVDPSKLTSNPGSPTTCETINKNVVTASQGLVVKPDWGGIDAAFQIVPPGGELCGSLYTSATATTGMPMIKSDLYGQAMVDFYQKAATAAGCTLKLEFEDAGIYNPRTKITGACGAKRVTILTDTGYDFYSMFAF